MTEEPSQSSLTMADGTMRLTQADIVRTASWKIVPSADTVVKGKTQELLLDADALDHYEEFTSDMHAVLRKYDAAMREMTVRFEILDRDLSLRSSRNPIHHIESRIKSPVSIYEKLIRYGKDPTIANLEKYLMDVAGVRVICSYERDVKRLVGLLRQQDDLEIVRIKNYIENPKPNGYRSLHIIVRIPVYFMDSKQKVPVEVQIRTIAMDYWASLEHELKYKAIAETQGIDVAQELRDIGKIIEGIEKRMQVLADALDKGSKGKKKKKKRKK